jgi:hypothetical protein
MLLPWMSCPFVLFRQVLYHSSHASNLYLFVYFCFSYFSGCILSFCLGSASDRNLPTYGLPSSRDHKQVPPLLGLSIEISVANFLLWLALAHKSQKLNFQEF